MMKMVLVMASLMVSTTAFAAPGRSSSGGGNEITAAIGMDKGAINIGAEYEMKANGFGGYFLMQTEKEKSGSKIVKQVMAVGGQSKIHLFDNGVVDAFMAPGFGLHMIKDVQDGAKTSDVTTFGPSLRFGALFNLTPALKLGLTRQEIWNWFDEKAESHYAFYQAAVAFSF